MITEKKKLMNNNELREMRRVAGLTQEKLARIMGVTAVYICYRELEYTNPRHVPIDEDFDRRVRAALKHHYERNRKPVKREGVGQEEVKRDSLEGFSLFTGRKDNSLKKITISEASGIIISGDISKEHGLDGFDRVFFYSDGTNKRLALKFVYGASSKFSYQIYRDNKGPMVRVKSKRFFDVHGLPYDAKVKSWKWIEEESTLIIELED